MDAPVALQDRKKKLNTLFKTLAKIVQGSEETLGDLLYFVFIELCREQLSVEVDDIESAIRSRFGERSRPVLRLFRRSLKQIKEADLTPDESKALFAKLMIWATIQLAHPHLETLRREERIAEEAAKAAPRTPP